MTTYESSRHSADRRAAGRPPAPPRVRRPAVLAFLAIAYGLGWLLAVPLWVTGGLAPGGATNPLLLPVGVAVMATPAIAALVVTRTVLRPARPARFLGLTPLRPWRRTLGYAALGFVGSLAVGVTTVLLVATTGALPLVTNPHTVELLRSIVPASLLISVAALGEELGWRGFLLPVLRPLGTWRALVISGAVWGPWHAPLLLLGYNYGRTDLLPVVLMTVTTTLTGIVFGWLRMRSASVWPSTFAHGAMNGSAGALTGALLPIGASTTAATLLGWGGWLVLAVIVFGLAAGRAFRWATPGPVPTAAPLAAAG